MVSSIGVFIFRFSSDGLPFWIGLNDGYFNSLDGEYQWTDGSTSVVQVAGSTAGNVSCVVLDPANQTYTAQSCTDQNMFVCLRRYGGQCVSVSGFVFVIFYSTDIVNPFI